MELLNRLGAIHANAQEYHTALQYYNQALSMDPACPRVLFNQGISQMCSKDYYAATKSFIQALQHQLPVDVVHGVRAELADRYTTIWETLRSTIELSDLPNREQLLQACNTRDLNALKTIS